MADESQPTKLEVTARQILRKLTPIRKLLSWAARMVRHLGLHAYAPEPVADALHN